MPDPADSTPRWAVVHSLFAELASESKAVRQSYVGSKERQPVQALAEVERRITSLRWALREIQQLYEAEFNAHLNTAMTAFVDTAKADQMLIQAMELTSRVEFMCEAFYLSAFRIFDLARETKGLGFKASGVRDVRNHLIIHPEGKHGVVGWSFGSGAGSEGPIFKPARGPEDEGKFQDPGFIHNAEEFARGC